MAKKTETVEQTSTDGRDKSGRFVKGNNANPRGRAPLPPEFKEFAKQAPMRLRQIADDKKTPVKVKADIEKWFVEMYHGKAPQALDLEGEIKQVPVVFSGDNEVAE